MGSQLLILTPISSKSIIRLLLLTFFWAFLLVVFIAWSSFLIGSSICWSFGVSIYPLLSVIFCITFSVRPRTCIASLFVVVLLLLVVVSRAVIIISV